MATIHYQFADGHFEDIEVTDEFAARYAEMEHKDKLIERKETRRHQSLDKSLENGWDVADPRVDVQAEAERNEENLRLHNAIAALTDKQRELLRLVYFENVPQTEIAAREGVQKTAINNRLTRILERLKKLLD